MEAFKQALLKKMQAYKDGEKPKAAMELEIEGQGDDDEAEEDKKGSELAPEIGEDDDHGIVVEDKEHEQGEEALLKQILEALSDKSSLGRGAMGLGERAAMGAKAKLDSMK